MWREVSLSGVLFSPIVVYALAAFLIMLLLRPLLVRLGFQRWTWNTPLAEAALYVCVLALLLMLL